MQTLQSTYRKAFNDAVDMLNMCPELEITSALKQCASDRGIPYGESMGNFVRWAYEEMGLNLCTA